MIEMAARVAFSGNFITAGLLMGLLCLVTRGYYPHLRLIGDEPINYVARGIFAICGGLGLRLVYWDIVPAIWSTLSADGWVAWYALSGSIPNVGFNIIIGYGVYQLLKALHASLPAQDRPHWTWWSAPFYPRRFWLSVTRRHD